MPMAQATKALHFSLREKSLSGKNSSINIVNMLALVVFLKV